MPTRVRCCCSLKFIIDIINLYNSNFDTEDGSVVIPDVFAKVKSSDAPFESVSSTTAKKLVL